MRQTDRVIWLRPSGGRPAGNAIKTGENKPTIGGCVQYADSNTGKQD